MKAALLLSIAVMICAVAAGFGIPAIYWAGEAVVGILGLVVGMAYAAVPPVLVLVYRKIRSEEAR